MAVTNKAYAELVELNTALEAKLIALREFLAESPLPVVDAQAISDIIDGSHEDEHPELCECGRPWGACVAFDDDPLNPNAVHGDR